MNPKKLVLHFSEVSTIFYTFYKFLQKWNTIEVEHLRRGPCKELELRNWVPWPWKAAAPAEFLRAGRAPGRGGGGAWPHAHLGRGGVRGLSGEGSSEGARRRPAVTPAAAGGDTHGGLRFRRGKGNVEQWRAAQASMAPREWARRVGRTREGAGRWARRQPTMAGWRRAVAVWGEGMARFL
jgi:hypothetical protein